MSIIEQTLDKLERSTATEKVYTEPTMFDYQLRHSNTLKTHRTLLLSFLIMFFSLLALSYVIISQGLKLNVPLDKATPIVQVIKHVNKKTPLEFNDIESVATHSISPEITHPISPNSIQKTKTKAIAEIKTTTKNDSPTATVSINKINQENIIERVSIPDLENQIPHYINTGNYQNALNILNVYQEKLKNTW